MSVEIDPETAIESLARLYPWSVESGEELGIALAFLRWGVTPAEVVRAGYGAGVAVGGVGLLVVLALPTSFRLAGLLGVLALALFATHAVHTTPELVATARRTSALGTTPHLVARAVLGMRLEPTPERAAVAAARSGEGVLSESLARHVRGSRNTPRSGLATFAEEWGEWFPALRRATALLSAAGSVPSTDRDRLLDRALGTVLEGVRDNVSEFAANIRGQVTALYAFGVLLPTALVALLPAAGAAGFPVTTIPVVLVYDIVLPGVLVVFSVRLLARRPIAFPPPKVTSAHPDVPDRTRLAPLAGFGTAALAWLAGIRLFPSWGSPLAALGFGCGVALLVRYGPVMAVHERVRRAEDGLPDALALVGRRVANGRPVETAIEQTAAELDGKMGDVLEAGATRQRQVQVGVREAFLGRRGDGALVDLPSPRVRGSVSLLALAATEGQPAGRALSAMGDHLDELRRIERESRHDLAYICRTLRSTAAVFAPLVTGATVGLADGIGSGGLTGSDQSLPWLGGVVGVYTLVLAVVLAALATGLTSGLDRSLVGYRVGWTLVSATAVFLCAYLLVGFLV